MGVSMPTSGLSRTSKGSCTGPEGGIGWLCGQLPPTCKVSEDWNGERRLVLIPSGPMFSFINHLYSEGLMGGGRGHLGHPKIMT